MSAGIEQSLRYSVSCLDMHLQLHSLLSSNILGSINVMQHLPSKPSESRSHDTRSCKHALSDTTALRVNPIVLHGLQPLHWRVPMKQGHTYTNSVRSAGCSQVLMTSGMSLSEMSKKRSYKYTHTYIYIYFVS